MIKIKQSKTADSRTCDVTKVSKKQLLESSEQHIDDVRQGMDFFIKLMSVSALLHDRDKIINIKSFYDAFTTDIESSEWLRNHYKLNRHHLKHETGVPEDVNLVDVFEMIVDCVMAGKGRNGDKYYRPNIDSELLWHAFTNTVVLLENEVVVEE